MVNKKILLGVTVIAMLTLSVGVAWADEVTSDINYQGRLADSAGKPLSGTYSMTFQLYDVSSGGTALDTDIHDVVVTDGLFNTEIDFDQSYFDGRALWLGIKVGTDSEMTPRQEFRPVPYALSLVPGAVIDGFLSRPVLKFNADGDNSYGAYAYTTGYDSEGFYAYTTGEDSEGFYAETFGDYSEGVNARTAGKGSEGVYAKTTGRDSPAVYGWSEKSVGVRSNGNTYDFYADGPGTNYGPFTGAHEVKLSADFPENVTPGMIVSVTGETQVRQIDGRNISFSSTLPTVQLSDTPDDSKVLGVLISESPLIEEHWYIDELNERDRFGIVNALGDGRVWVTDINGDIEAGDYITTSLVAGYGQKQNDDLLHSYTLGKAIGSVNWSELTTTVEFNGQIYKAYPIAVVYTSG
jgi:hypothetical protein